MNQVKRWIGPVLLACALLALVEGVLASRGMGAPPLEASLGRGFDADSRSFAERQGGSWVLLDAEGAPTDRVVPPKRAEAFRVLLFGGSNVAGFPDRQLEFYLQRQVPELTWDIVNLGRSGYGSARVRQLVSEALGIFEPDLVFVYSGHNEFVERGLQMDIETQWNSEWMGTVGELSRKLRTVNTLAAYMRTSTRDAERDWENEDRKFDRFSFEQTLHQLSWFDQNLTSIAELTHEHGVPLAFGTVVYNHFAKPWVAGSDPNLTDEQRALFGEHMWAARALYPPYLKSLALVPNAHRLHPQDWKRCKNEGMQPRGELTEPRPLEGHLARYGMEPPNESCWSEKVQRFYDALFAFHAKDPVPDLELAERRLHAAVEIDPQHAFALFELALVSYVLDRDLALVTDLLDRAGDFDCAPRRGSRAINDRMRRIAAAHSVPLFDAEQVFRELVPEGLIGWETMRDQCHLHPGARRALMDMLGDFISTHPAVRAAGGGSR